MRIRSIKPEFWRSDDIAALHWNDRLLFIGLWSYVDDNGVGLDKLAAITADLFANDIERDPSEAFARVSGGLQKLAEKDLVTRFEVDGKRYIFINNWNTHQRIDKPAKARYPEPTLENTGNFEYLARSSRDTPEILAPGTGEQGNRGTDKKTCAPAPADDALFEKFWDTYPRKKGKGKAREAWVKATKTKRVEPATVLASLESHLPEWSSKDRDLIPYPATWLNQERWLDVIETPAVETVVFDPDSILGRDLWQLPTPPEDLRDEDYLGWAQDQRLAHLAEREAAAKRRIGVAS